MPCHFAIYKKVGTSWRKLPTHKLTSRTDALHHVRDIHAYNPRARLKVARR